MPRYLERVAGSTLHEESLPNRYDAPVPVWLEEVAPEILSLARVLGIRTAELHMTLARADTPGLTPEEGTPADVTRLVERVRTEARLTRRMMKEHAERLESLPDDVHWEAGLRRLETLLTIEPQRQKIRIHGDYHLGQVLRAEGEFFILDFEGEPARTLEERRQLDFALRDVAGMLRSLEYAAFASWREHVDSNGEGSKAWAIYLVRWLEAVFLTAYLGTADEADFVQPTNIREPLLWAYLFDKALYEVRYELNHRPDWTWLPLRGLMRLLDQARATDE
jgi:maltose alpha-D-glucosyltransferase / alpha-amylase